MYDAGALERHQGVGVFDDGQPLQVPAEPGTCHAAGRKSEHPRAESRARARTRTRARTRARARTRFRDDGVRRG